MTSTDPVRDDVEAALRRVVHTVTAVPCGVLRAVWQLLGWDNNAGARLGRADPTGAPASPVGDAIDEVPTAEDRQRPRRVGERRPDSAGLAIAGYEDLAASNIVARLERLAPAELEQIRTFEIAHRGRRTVVGKIDQLLAGS